LLQDKRSDIREAVPQTTRMSRVELGSSGLLLAARERRQPFIRTVDQTSRKRLPALLIWRWSMSWNRSS